MGLLAVVLIGLVVYLVRTMTGAKITVVGLNPKTREPIIRKMKYPPGGKLTLKGVKESVMLEGTKMWGTIAFIDLSNGVQLDYRGLDGWDGIDGHQTWVHERDLSFQQVAAANQGDLMKYVKYALILVGINFAALIAGMAYLSQKIGK
jgi:hypothetical protein